MDETRLVTIGQIVQFLAANAAIKFTATGDDAERYAHIGRVLKRFDYPRRGKVERGVLRCYLRHTSGYSRAQITRLICRWQGNRLAAAPLAKRYGAPKEPFARKYTVQDVALLVEMDRANEDVCGPSIAHLLRRAFCEYGDTRHERLAGISVAHLYNLRKRADYRAQRQHFTATRPASNAIGMRRAPAPDGHAGFVRIDTVHQGDLDGVKGIYHITCVDIVSQWQIEACAQGISEAYLLPVINQIIDQFPFVIGGFHSDNGSEFINHQVARLLEKLRIEQTKSRSRHSNDNALAESKNASVVRKHMGYAHIPQHHAKLVNAFYQERFNPWLNMHRPCLFATETVSAKGKIVKKYRYENVCTPLEKLSRLCEAQQATLKPGITLAALQATAKSQTDLAAAQAMQRAKAALFARFASANSKPDLPTSGYIRSPAALRLPSAE